MFKNRYILVITILLVLCNGINGQSAKRQVPDTTSPGSSVFDASYPEIKAKAKATADALVRADFNTVADHTYPKVIRLMGGRANMISTTAQEMRKMESSGFTIKSVSVVEPNKVQIIGTQIFSIVPMAMTMRVPGGTMLVESFLIAISEDGSKTWKFVDGTIAGNRPMLRRIFPVAADKLRLPPKKQPVVYRNERG
jgi:hypothetical protein